jgi:hypothetical protein
MKTAAATMSSPVLTWKRGAVTFANGLYACQSI